MLAKIFERSIVSCKTWAIRRLLQCYGSKERPSSFPLFFPCNVSSGAIKGLGEITTMNQDKNMAGSVVGAVCRNK